TNPLPTLAFRGSYHFDEGFYFFRNTEDGRVLFGGGRNLDLDGENTTDFGLSERIQKSLEEELRNFILPQVDPEQLHIEQRWSGIMGMGPQRTPIIRQLSDHVYCGVRLTGTGIAIGSLVGEELAQLVLQRD